MQVIFHALAIATLFIPATKLQAVQPPVAPTLEIAQAQKAISTTIPVVLPVSAKVWLKAGGVTTGQVTGFDAQKQVLILGGETTQLARISKVVFDRKALAYRSDGTIVIRGEDTSQAKQKNWQNIPLGAFQLKDKKLGQALIDLAGVIKPIEIKGIQSVAKKSVYVVDEIQFQSAGKMTIKVTASDR